MKRFFLTTISLILSMALLASCCTIVFAEDVRMEGGLDLMVEAANENDVEEVVRLIQIDETDIIDETAEVTITIDENRDPIVRDDIKALLGTEHEAGHFGGDLFLNNDGTYKEGFAEKMAEMTPQTVIRWGGGRANGWNLAKVIQPDVSQRELGTVVCENEPGYTDFCMVRDGVENIRWVAETTLQYGPPEFIKANLLNNPDAQFLFCISNIMMTPEDTANFVRWCLDDKDESQWGRMRAQCGLEEPINLYGIEMSNELYYRQTITDEQKEQAERGTMWYVNSVKKHAEAIHAIYPDVKIIPLLNSDSFRAGWEEWNRPIIRELGNLYPEMSYHIYYSGYEWAYQHVKLDKVLEMADEILGPDNNFKIAMTEHSPWGTANRFGRCGLYAGLAAANFVNLLSQYEDVVEMNYNSIFGNPGISSSWPWIHKVYDDTYLFTGTVYSYRIYNDYIGDRVLPVDVNSEHPTFANGESTAQAFTVMATPKGEDELVLFMVNRAPYIDANIKFESGNNYTIKKEIVMTAPNIYSFEANAETQGVITTTTTDKNEPLSTYHMPNKSLVCLVLESDKPIGNTADDGPGETGATFEGESRFDDVDGHWAFAEINLLAEQGVINGVSETEFAPHDGVTFAEFSAMVTRATGMEVTPDSEQIFPAVNKGAWYYDAVNALALNGFLRRNADVQPEAAVTLIDAVTMLYRIKNVPEVSGTEDYEAQYAWYGSLTAFEKDAVAFAIQSGDMTKLFEASTSTPNRALNRAECAYLIYNALN